MLHGKANINKLAPRLRAAVLRLEQLTNTDFIISIPAKAAMVKSPKGNQQAQSVRIQQRINNAKPSKPGEVLNNAAKAAASEKPDWFSYKSGVFSIVTKETKAKADMPEAKTEE